jgi:general secretion pathway protein D
MTLSTSLCIARRDDSSDTPVRSHRRTLAALVCAIGLVSCTGSSTTQRAIRPTTAIPASEQASSGINATDPVSSTPAVEPFTQRGSGIFVAPAQPVADAPNTNAEGFQLSFVDADLSIVVGSVLGDALGLAYAVDPQVKGTLTLQSVRPIPREQLLAALETALRAQELAVVNVNGTYTVVPFKDAPRRLTGFRAPESRGQPGYGIQIVPLQYLSATEMQRTLEPFAPAGGVLRVDEARNLLVIAGTGTELAAMLEVIRTFDVDWLAGMSFGLYTLNYVDARTLATELQQVFGDEKSPLAGVVRIVPLPRLNSLLAITPRPDYLQQVEGWVKRLDLGGTTPGRRIYVYDVQNGRAADLAKSLSQILALADFSGNTEAASEGAEGGSLQGPPTLTRQPPSRSNDSTSSEGFENGGLRIVPNDESNALMILATPSEFAVIESALVRLDATPLQVLIEASLAEVTLTDEMQYGVQWAYQGGDGPLILSESSSGGVAQRFPGFSYLFTGRSDIRAVLNAIESITNVRVISSPKLMVLNNREASLQVGDQVPVTVQSSVSSGDSNAPIVNSVQFRDTGVILRVTPRVNKNGLVQLEIAQEVSEVVPTTSSGIDSPTIQQRKLSTTVSVRSSETIALGGLIREGKSKTRSGVPFLRRIPALGAAFGSTGDTRRRTELVVLITPRVIRSNDDVTDMMQDLRETFRGLRKLLPPPAAAPAATPAPTPPTSNAAPAN